MLFHEVSYDFVSYRHIFEHAIQSFLKDKLVLLVTNNLQYLPEASSIIALEKGGKVVASGSFHHLEKHNASFKEMVAEHGIYRDKKKNTKVPFLG